MPSFASAVLKPEGTFRRGGKLAKTNIKIVFITVSSSPAAACHEKLASKEHLKARWAQGGNFA